MLLLVVLGIQMPAWRLCHYKRLGMLSMNGNHCRRSGSLDMHIYQHFVPHIVLISHHRFPGVPSAPEGWQLVSSDDPEVRALQVAFCGHVRT